MSTLKKANSMSKMGSVTDHDDLLTTLAHHDAVIGNLSGRMTGVETGLKALDTNVNRGFSELSSKFDKLDARPSFNFHQGVTTVVSLAVLFSMVVGGIIWVTTGQFAGMIAEQRGFNANTKERMDNYERTLAEVARSLGWVTNLKPGGMAGG